MNKIIEFFKNLGLDYCIIRERRICVRIKPTSLRDTVEILIKNFNPRFIMITINDDREYFDIIYHFSIKGVLLSLSANLSKKINEIDTISDLIPQAELAEQECFELFGVNFKNHKPSKNFLLLESSTHPLRKEYISTIPGHLELILSTGCAARISSYIKKGRKKLGLPPSPTMCDGKTIQKLKKIIEE